MGFYHELMKRRRYLRIRAPSSPIGYGALRQRVLPGRRAAK
jgi:hypothetical protein